MGPVEIIRWIFALCFACVLIARDVLAESRRRVLQFGHAQMIRLSNWFISKQIAPPDSATSRQLSAKSQRELNAIISEYENKRAPRIYKQLVDRLSITHDHLDKLKRSEVGVVDKALVSLEFSRDVLAVFLSCLLMCAVLATSPRQSSRHIREYNRARTLASTKDQ